MKRSHNLNPRLYCEKFVMPVILRLFANAGHAMIIVISNDVLKLF